MDRGEFKPQRAPSPEAVRRAGPLVLTTQRIAAHSYLVRLAGELDLAGRPAAEEEITALRAEGTDVALDLSELVFLDSSGLRLLLDLTRPPDGVAPVRLVAASRAVMRVAELTGTAARLGL